MDVVVDLDGTLADCTHRLHHIRGRGRKNWDAFFAGCHIDKPNPVVVALVKALHKDHRLIFCSAPPCGGSNDISASTRKRCTCAPTATGGPTTSSSASCWSACAPTALLGVLVCGVLPYGEELLRTVRASRLARTKFAA